MFKSGADDCASCICIENEIKCNTLKCRESAFMNKEADNIMDFTNIRNQLVKFYFSKFDAVRLKKITDGLGCKTTDCPQLIAASKLDYKVLSLDRQEYNGRSSKQNKIVVHSTDAEAVNNSPSKQEIKTVRYSMKVTQYSEATVAKSIFVSSDVSITIYFVSFGVGFKFGKSSTETKKNSNTTTLDVPSQTVVVDPYTKINVTFNFYQYEDINNYMLDFVIGKGSIITHPDVDASSNIHFVKQPLDEFLKKNVDILPKLRYENDKAVKVSERDGKLVLQNLPATEKLSNFGVDVVFGKSEPIRH